MDILSQYGKSYIFFSDYKCKTKPPLELKYSLFKILNSDFCELISVNKKIKTNWHINNISNEILQYFLDNNFKDYVFNLFFRIVESENNIFKYNIYLNTTFLSFIVDNNFNTLYSLNEKLDIFKKIQNNYFESLNKIDINRFYSFDYNINEINDSNFIKFKLSNCQEKSLKWMIEKENIGNKYLNPNIDYIKINGSRFFLKNNDFSRIYQNSYHINSYFKCFGGVLANGSKSGKTLICLLLSSNYNKKLIDIPMIPEREFYFNSNSTLVLVPSELLSYWINEINKFFGKDLPYKVIDSKSSAELITFDDLKKTNIFITTYKFIENRNLWDSSNEFGISLNKNINLNFIWWNRIIYDEYQKISNSKNYVSLKSHFKWCVSSTPDLLSNL